MSKNNAVRTSGTGGNTRALEHEEYKGSVDGNAEPEISQEDDIPSDGADPEAEAEMKKLAPRPELLTPAENARK